MNNEAKILESDMKVPYTARELNSIASAILSSLTDAGEVDMELGLKMKMFFNTVISATLTDRETCDEILAEVEEYEKSIGFDIVKAATEIARQTKYES